MSNLMSNYKLRPEIKQFIIERKKLDPKLSCRQMASVVEESFKIKLSKSLINNVIKDAKLSNVVGRQRIRGIEPKIVDNGGCIFLKAADLKLCLSDMATEFFSNYCPDIQRKELKMLVQLMLYLDLFKIRNIESLDNYKGHGLWWIIGAKDPIKSIKLMNFCRLTNQIPVSEALKSLDRGEITHNINNLNELYKEYLARLNSYVLTNFFPQVFQFFDFSAMKMRFYYLPANINKAQNILNLEFFCPENFFWKNDIIWQEGLSYAANKINSAQIFITKTEQIFIKPHLKSQNENAFFS